MSRVEWEMKAVANRNGYRSVNAMMERRAKERRIAKLAYSFAMDRRDGERRS